MEENKLFNNRYFLERLLGRGNFSEVWLAKDTKTDIKVALKIYAPATGLDDAGLNVFAREFSLVVNANHKNLLKPLYYDSCDKRPFLVLPYCEQGSIMKLVGKMSEKDAWRLLHDVASGLSWLHGMNPPVIHQDIKPDNVMIGENGDFMITDFGISTHVKSTLRKSLSVAFSSAGTIAYMAPERFSKDNTPIMANDVYSLGATVYEMLTGDAPFGDDGGLIQMKGAEIPDLKGDFSPQLKKVVSLCLSTNPWERPTAEQLEKYANDGLNGGKIVFVGDKNFWQKYKLLVVSGMLVLLAGGAVAMIFLNKHNEGMAAELLEKQTKAYNDSIETLASRGISVADSFAEIGFLHDERYEEALIAAYQKYEEVLSYKLKNGSDPLRLMPPPSIEDRLQNVGKQLCDAHRSFMEKTEIFSNEPEVANEFLSRAKAIEDVINIKEYDRSNNTSSAEEREPETLTPLK